MTAASDCEFCAQFHSETETKSVLKNQFIGKAVAAVCGLSSVAIVTLCVPFLRPAFRKICLPFVPATDVQVANVLTAVTGSRGSFLDCGSGDGRIVFAAARAGFKATGVELNSSLVLYSRILALISGLRKDVTFEHRDMFTVDFEKYDNVVVFGVDSLMPELEKVLLSRQKRTLQKVVACRFPLPNCRPVRTVGQGIDTVWLYHFPSTG